MKVILDGSFIIACSRKEVDFISQLREQKFKIVVPREVLQELKDMRYESYASRIDKASAKKFLDIVDTHKIEKVGAGQQNIRNWLIQEGHRGFYIATIDSKINKAVPNRVTLSKEGKIKIEKS